MKLWKQARRLRYVLRAIALQPRNLLQRQAQRDQVARVAGAGAQSPERPFQVAHLGELRAEALQARRRSR